MRKKLSIVFFILLPFAVRAQYRVRFVLKEQTAIHHDSIYVTGTFSNWDSTANKNYLLQPYGNDEKSIVLTLPKGPIRYKFHRGSWHTVEKEYNGEEVPDRVVFISKDTTFIDSIAAWRDQVIIDKKFALSHQTSDTARVSILAGIAANYAFWTDYLNIDSALYYANEALQLQQKIIKSGEYGPGTGDKNALVVINLQEMTATLFHSLGNYPKSLELRLDNLARAEKVKDKFIVAISLRRITDDYVSMRDYQNVLRYGKLLDSVVNTLDVHDKRFRFAQLQAKSTLANAFYNLNLTDSALYYANKASAMGSSNSPYDSAFTNLLLGNIYAKMGKDSAAFYYYRLAYPAAIHIYNPQILAAAFEGMARLFKKNGEVDSALHFALQAMGFLQSFKTTVQSWGENSNTYIAEISPLVAELYKDNNQPDSAYKYLQLSVTLKDSLYNSDKVRQFQTLTFNEATRQQQLEQQGKLAKQEYDRKVRMYGLFSIVTGALIFAFILYRNNKQKQKANVLLQSQKNELETTLSELKSTQSQLIQSEKMASLGELTAGIAHEIQNPLNFVNNFSEVNKEMLEELKAERLKQKAERDDTLQDELINDVIENSEKINHHGKRARDIVKGMLQHSRSSTGVKEFTDINALCDEYLRLSYHGLRAKDKDFNAEMKTDFDHSIGKINIIPQDIGRVLLNLYNNAFYAVNEKQQAVNQQISGNLIPYEPTVSVTTKKSDNHIIITVSDNGNGIAQDIVDKIFQPFFTTKPTGSGTGLGLSLSYDIVKAHGGVLRVETKEGGSEFIIQLPDN